MPHSENSSRNQPALNSGFNPQLCPAVNNLCNRNETIRDAVTSLLMHSGKLLLLHRSQAVGTFRGKWAGVSGHLEPGEMPEKRALIEIEEETGISRRHVKILASGKPIITLSENMDFKWRVFPFLVESATDVVRLDWEHTEYRWIDPMELRNYDTVPNLIEVACALIDDDI